MTSLKPLWSGMGEVVPARTSPTLHSPSPPTVHKLSQLAHLRVNAVYRFLVFGKDRRHHRRLPNHQIRHQATCKVGSQPGDCRWPFNLPQESVGIYGLEYSWSPERILHIIFKVHNENHTFTTDMHTSSEVKIYLHLFTELVCILCFNCSYWYTF